MAETAGGRRHPSRRPRGCLAGLLPGLGGHPDHDLAAEQMDDFGGTSRFELDAGLEETAEFVTETDLFALAESPGGAESPIEQPATMTRAFTPPEQRRYRRLAF